MRKGFVEQAVRVLHHDAGRRRFQGWPCATKMQMRWRPRQKSRPWRTSRDLSTVCKRIPCGRQLWTSLAHIQQRRHSPSHFLPGTCLCQASGSLTTKRRRPGRKGGRSQSRRRQKKRTPVSSRSSWTRSSLPRPQRRTMCLSMHAGWGWILPIQTMHHYCGSRGRGLMLHFLQSGGHAR